MGKEWDRLSGGFSDGKFKGFHLPQTSGGNRNVKCPDCGKWVYDHYPRNCTCGGVERYKSRKMQEWHYQWATELYRVMKPGAHILVFGGTRTYHRMACAVEDSGFEVRDMINWVYGSGFPKSLDVSKSLDKIAGKEREVIGTSYIRNGKDGTNNETFKQAKRETTFITAPSTEEAIQWNGYGTGLKPAHEPILLARKTISERNIASNVLKWGVGGLNIGETRIGYLSNQDKESARIGFANIGWKHSGNTKEEMTEKEYDLANQQGRFPANLILECCCEEGELIEGEIGEVKVSEARRVQGDWLEKSGFGDTTKRITFTDKAAIHTNPNCVCGMLDEQSGELKTGEMNSIAKGGQYAAYGYQYPRETVSHKSKGGASRFFYQAKASQAERWFYCTICKAVHQKRLNINSLSFTPPKNQNL